MPNTRSGDMPSSSQETHGRQTHLLRIFSLALTAAMTMLVMNLSTETINESYAPKRQIQTKPVAESQSAIYGYRLVAADGGVFSFGSARYYGSTGNIHLNQPIVAAAGTPTGNGYWLVARDGGVFNFGDAKFYGSTGNIRLNSPIVSVAATPTGKGYWLVAADGGIFSYGDARFFGSTGNIPLNQPIVGMGVMSSGYGYWLAARDGGIFNFGSAPFRGSSGGTPLTQPIVGMASTPDNSYRLVASDGGVFAHGADFIGSAGATALNAPIVSLAGTPSGEGYWLVASDGGIFSYGDASFRGSTGNIDLNSPIVAITSTPLGPNVNGDPAPSAPAPSNPGTPTPTTTPTPHPTTTTTPPSSGAQYSTSLRPASGTAGWTIEGSGAQESVTVVGDKLVCLAGGYSASTHYARIKRKLPEVDDFAARGAFTLTSTFEMPADFYTNQESYMRFMNTDNYPAQMKTSHATVGARSADEWRVGFLVWNSDRRPRLISAHENHEEKILWTGSSPLSVGRHTVEVRFTPSQSNSGSWEVFIDGVRAGGASGVQTVPASLDPSEVVVTRVVGGIDGAADQDSRPISVNLFGLDFRADR